MQTLSKDSKDSKIPDKPGLSTALVKPIIELSQDFNLGSSAKHSKEIIDALSSKLDALNLTQKNILPVSQISDDSDNDCEISKFHHDLIAMENNKIEFKRRNNFPELPPSKHFYLRPTTQDLLFEEDIYKLFEEDINNVQSHFSADAIYEWTIDGFSEYTILTQLHRKNMYSTVCKAAKNNDCQIAEFIIASFTGQLRGWWENVLNENQRNEILSNVKIIHANITTKNEQGMDVTNQQPAATENAVYYLIIVIILAFIGPHPETTL